MFKLFVNCEKLREIVQFSFFRVLQQVKDLSVALKVTVPSILNPALNILDERLIKS